MEKQEGHLFFHYSPACFSWLVFFSLASYNGFLGAGLLGNDSQEKKVPADAVALDEKYPGNVKPIGNIVSRHEYPLFCSLSGVRFVFSLGANYNATYNAK